MTSSLNPVPPTNAHGVHHCHEPSGTATHDPHVHGTSKPHKGNESMRRFKKAAVAAALTTLALIGTTAGPASAALTECNAGQACLWKNSNYGGGYYGIYSKNGVNDLRTPGWQPGSGGSGAVDDEASSSASYGNTQCARFYEHLSKSGHYINYSRPALGGTYRDPYHENGAGTGTYAGENWNDRITSIGWVNC